MNQELERYCAFHGIFKTSTQGNDPNGNASAENTVGKLKSRARYLLSGCRLPTAFWGLAVLAAAQLERADASLERYPRIPFGTRAMLVRSPPHRNAFMPRAEPCTVFGPCHVVPEAFWVYQHGHIHPRTDLQPQGLSTDDLSWIKSNISNWDPPDAPMEIPSAEAYDAASLHRLLDHPVGAATRDSIKCEACIQLKRKKRQTSLHSLI